MVVNTLGDLRKLVNESELPDDTVICSICDHAGVSTRHLGGYIDLKPIALRKSKYSGYLKVEMDSPEKELIAITVG